MPPVKAVWATSAAREEFTSTERADCVEDYEQNGPQLFVGGGGFAYYYFANGRTMVLAEKDGKVSLFTLEEIQEEPRRRM